MFDHRFLLFLYTVLLLFKLILAFIFGHWIEPLYLALIIFENFSGSFPGEPHYRRESEYGIHSLFEPVFGDIITGISTSELSVPILKSNFFKFPVFKDMVPSDFRTNTCCRNNRVVIVCF